MNADERNEKRPTTRETSWQSVAIWGMTLIAIVLIVWIRSQ